MCQALLLGVKVHCFVIQLRKPELKEANPYCRGHAARKVWDQALGTVLIQ